MSLTRQRLIDGETTGSSGRMRLNTFARSNNSKVAVSVRGLDDATVQLYAGDEDDADAMVPMRDGLFESDEVALVDLPLGGWVEARIVGTSSTDVYVTVFGD